MKIIRPKEVIEIDPKLPLFFLAGPVLGAADWQKVMCGCLKQEMGDREFYVVIPCRYPNDHPLKVFFVQPKEVRPGKYNSQTEWERDYLEITGLRPGNCIIFWLPCESKRDPRGDGIPYACDTRGELGEWRGRMIAGQKVRMVIGAEYRFPGLEVIEKNFIFGVDTGFIIHTNLQTTARYAVVESRK